jgi:2-polyprenyl-3-methyl-5-hydroxy-6-metoxy-1,4-benzoquinol methylase
MAFSKSIAKLSHLSFWFISKAYNFVKAILSGFWLGVMSEKSLDFSDELYYNNNKSYTNNNYNLSGLFTWEKAMIEKYFSNAKCILLIAAGGGRETLALSKMGFEVDSYECNAELIEYGNLFLKENKVDSKIKYLPRNSIPDEIKKYDGIIIGWGAYSLIRGYKKRLSFLSRLFPLLQKEAPLMISFLVKEEKGRQEKIIKHVSNFFRNFSNRDKTELGDILIANFVHLFNEEEIKGELVQAKFRVIDYYNILYGCTISIIQT